MQREVITRPYRYQDGARRLAERSERRGDCVVYTWGSKTRSGHRKMRYHGRSRGVHCIAWTLVHGEIPPGRFVLHRCDVPNCINVDHLFLGTIADNNADRDRKGRHIPLPGSRNGTAKLSEHQIIEIRELAKQGVTQRAIAAKYGVTQRVIWLILRGKGWTHVKADAS